MSIKSPGLAGFWRIFNQLRLQTAGRVKMIGRSLTNIKGIHINVDVYAAHMTLKPTQCSSSQAILFSDETYISRHERHFSYVETGEIAPAIVLRHLWLHSA